MKYFKDNNAVVAPGLLTNVCRLIQGSSDVESDSQSQLTRDLVLAAQL